MKLLVIRFSSLGDVLIALETSYRWCMEYHQQFPKCIRECVFLVDTSMYDLLIGLENYHEQRWQKINIKFSIQTISKRPGLKFISKAWYLRQTCQAEDLPDLIFDLQQDWRSWFLRQLFLGTLVFRPARRSFERFSLRYFKLNYYDWEVAPKRFFSLLNFNLKNNFCGSARSVEERWFADLLEWVTGFFISHQKTRESSSSQMLFLQSKAKVFKDKMTILFFPGAAHPLKQWPIKYWLELSSLLDNLLPPQWEFKWVWGPKDRGVDALLEYKSLYQRKITYEAGTLGLSELPHVIKQGRLVICNDSFPAHLAHSFGISTAVFFGPTHEAFGFAYTADPNYLLLTTTLGCRPCSSTGSGRCRFTSQYCFQQLEPHHVFELLKAKFFQGV